MKIKTLIKLDKHLGRFIATCINWAIRLLGLIFRKNHNLEIKYSTIAISKYKGMGSIIHTIPMIQTLKVKYPEAKIIFITTENNREILKLLGIVDEIITLNDKELSIFLSLPRFIFQLIRKKIELFIDLELYSSFSSIITALSFSKNRIGFYQRSENYRFGIYSHMMYYNINAPVSDTYLQIAQLVGCKTTAQKTFTLILEKPDISSSIIEKPYILINPNASDLRLERRWPKESFINLIKELNKYKPDYNICLIGSPIEEKYVNSIIDQVPNKIQVKSFAGKTNLKELILLIQNSELFISNDTGPMHLAALLGKTTIALFGPCSPSHYGNHNTLRILYKNLYCSPCVHEFSTPPCNGNNVCMKIISVEEVLNLCMDYFETKLNGQTHNNSFNSFIYTTEDYLAGYIKR